ncbi:hypothetical protein Bca4012_068648 [Brassica carinata]
MKLWWFFLLPFIYTAAEVGRRVEASWWRSEYSVEAGDVVAACLEASWIGSSLCPRLRLWSDVHAWRCERLRIRLVVYGCGESLLIDLLAFFCSLPEVHCLLSLLEATAFVGGLGSGSSSSWLLWFATGVAFYCHIMDPSSLLGGGHLASEFERSGYESVKTLKLLLGGEWDAIALSRINPVKW